MNWSDNNLESIWLHAPSQPRLQVTTVWSVMGASTTVLLALVFPSFAYIKIRRTPSRNSTVRNKFSFSLAPPSVVCFVSRVISFGAVLCTVAACTHMD